MPEFDVKCRGCGEILDANFYILGLSTYLEVELCEKCEQRAKDEGYKEGKDEE